MSRRFLNNAFSLSMLGPVDGATLQVSRLSLERAREVARDAISVVGHPTTRALFATALGREVACDRQSILLEPDDELVVGQYTGPRLAEGARELPEGATVDWFLVKWAR
jgi:hypothetical protein